MRISLRLAAGHFDDLGGFASDANRNLAQKIIGRADGDASLTALEGGKPPSPLCAGNKRFNTLIDFPSKLA
jgi:hypothetical protein